MTTKIMLHYCYNNYVLSKQRLENKRFKISPTFSLRFTYTKIHPFKVYSSASFDMYAVNQNQGIK